MDRAAKIAADRLIRSRKATRARRGRLCPVCQHPDWCLFDEAAALCARSNGAGSAGKFGQYGYLYLLRESQPGAEAIPRPKPEQSAANLDRWIRPIAQRAYQDAQALRQKAADELGVSVAALDLLRCGVAQWSGRPCWTFPERDAAGLVIGMQYRAWGTGDKWQLLGGRRGLYYARDWLAVPGPVHLVEGASDTAAGIDEALCVVGRPSNSGGLRYLVRLLANVDRRIYVYGERDKKEHEDLKPAVRERHEPGCRGCPLCWPGMAGAQRVVDELRDKLPKLGVYLKLPGSGAKDLRAQHLVARRRLDIGSQVEGKAAGTLLEPIVRRLVAEWRGATGTTKERAKAVLAAYWKYGRLPKP